MNDNYFIKRDVLLKLKKYNNIRMLRKIVDNLSDNMSLKRKSLEGLISLSDPTIKVNLNNYLDYDSDDTTIILFINKLKEHFSHCDLSSFYERIKTLEIKEGDLKLQEEIKRELGKESGGFYDVRENSITLFDKKDNHNTIKNIKLHELLHMASSKRGRYLQLTGFKRTDLATETSIGEGLNEGYTEYLINNYFSEKATKSYVDLRLLAWKIGNIIGQKKMQQFYFTNDLNGIITELTKYTTKEKAIELIQKMDKLNNIPYLQAYKQEYQKLYNEMKVDVANIALIKYKQAYDNGKMSKEKYKRLIYDLELYINSIVPYFGRNKNNPSEIPEKVALSRDCAHLMPIAEISYQEYKEHVNEYYESFQGNIIFSYEPWTDSNGKTTKDYLHDTNKEYVKLYSTKYNSQESSTIPSTTKEPIDINKARQISELQQMLSDKTETTTSNLNNEQTLRKTA